MKKLLALFLTALLLTACVFSAQAAPEDVDAVKQSVVRLLVHYTIDDPRYPTVSGDAYATGSGFFVGDINDPNVQYIVTAGHVMGRYPEVGMDTQVFPFTLPDGSSVVLQVKVAEIRVLWTDISDYSLANEAGYSSRADVAVIALNAPTTIRKPAVLLPKSDFTSSDTLYAMGFPSSAEYNLDVNVANQLLADTNSVKVTSGTFSTWNPHATTQHGDQINTNANMDHGVSGGPLVNADGYVVGVCVTGNTESQNHAVAMDEVLSVLGGINGAKYTVGPLKKGLSTTMIIIIAVAVVAIAVLLGLILANNSKKNARSLELKGSMGGKVVPLKKGTPVVVGRDPKRCQIVYPKDAAGVSSVHCTITFDGNQVTVADNGSSYGTFVGGQKVEPGKPMVMHRGQEVTFGSDKNSAALH